MHFSLRESQLSDSCHLKDSIIGKICQNKRTHSLLISVFLNFGALVFKGNGFVEEKCKEFNGILGLL